MEIIAEEKKEETLYTLYLHTCLANNKVYVGVTCKDASDRWLDGDGYKSNYELYSDIKLYGWDKGFNHKVVNDNLTWDKVKEAEKYFIDVFDATNPDKGYNHRKGGSYGGHKKRKIDVSQKIRALRKQKKLSQTELAEIISSTRASVGSWETGRRVPYFEDLKKIADYFGVGLDYFTDSVSNSGTSDDIVARVIEYFNSSEIDLDDKVDLFNNIVSAYSHYILEKN